MYMITKITKLHSGKASIQKKQRGATLFTTLIFLTLMAIVSVTAVKISMLDILIAGSNKQRVELFQKTSNQLKKTATINTLSSTFTIAGFTGNVDGNAKQFLIANSPNLIEERVTDLTLEYPCERQGRASSIGANSPPCDLYDFEVRSRKQGSGAREKHNRGAGKMVPNSGSKGSLL